MTGAGPAASGGSPVDQSAAGPPGDVEVRRLGRPPGGATDTGGVTWSIRLAPAALRRILFAIVLAVLLLQGAAWTLVRLQDLILIGLVAWLFALAVEPVVQWLSHRGMSRAAAAASVLLSMLALLAAFLVLFGQLLISQAIALSGALPTTMQTLIEWSNRTLGTELTLDQGLTQLAGDLGLLNLTADQANALVSGVVSGLTGALTGTFGVLLGLATGGLFAFYLSADAPRLRARLASLLPPPRQRVLDTVWQIAAGKAGGYLISRLTLAFIAAAASAVFFLIIDLPYWLPLALFNGIVSQFIPTIGVYIGAALPVLVGFTENPWNGLIIIVFATAYQQVENYLLLPRISASTMNIHPAVALASVLAGALLFGVIGALIAIPVVAAVIAILDTYTQRHALVEAFDSGAGPSPGPGQPRGAGPSPGAGQPPGAGPSPGAGAPPRRRWLRSRGG
ncbi:MAG: AI-2E family transporter [Actinomycetales bacterium]|nr:AI-2E family transporter [Actinomycetales bacterium]